MNEISPEQLLAQMRALKSELQGFRPVPEAAAAGATGFGESLARAVESVNQSQMTARNLKADYAAETGEASLAEVMVAAQKADLSFRAMTEVRNKLVNAYQEIMNMPV